MEEPYEANWGLPVTHLFRSMLSACDSGEVTNYPPDLAWVIVPHTDSCTLDVT